MNMKPAEILSLLEEASGTKLYERKKESAMKTLAKKQTKLDEIDEVCHLYTCAVACHDRVAQQEQQHREPRPASIKLQPSNHMLHRRTAPHRTVPHPTKTTRSS